MWTESDLLQLIELGVQENVQLDYKRCDALQRSDGKKNEISKDVSALANAAGGTIVYGIIENGHLPQALDLGFDPSDITREWLEQIINSRIQRRIDGVRINQVALPQSAPGRVAYVVWVPQSAMAPHQASDKRFYKRFNFESVPMEEYEIRDVSGRSSTPDISARFSLSSGKEHIALIPDEEGYSQDIDISLSVFNESPVPAEYAVFHILLDERVQVGDFSADVNRHRSDEGESFKIAGASVHMNKFTTLWDRNRGLPLFSGITAQLPNVPLPIKIPCQARFLMLGYIIGAPGMQPKRGYAFVKIESNIATLALQDDLERSGYQFAPVSGGVDISNQA
ncbi:helix-turn-helix domain-containing protein [Burkholderia sp. 22PA0106]|uniref:AlbA family DNA-binding domain-containing protein n=1 Tax=Burkholderia sp. 22PA0106 TaxID=3237371 RepID=UPI0039C2DB5F